MALYRDFEKFVSKYGVAVPACMLGHRDTVAIKNWLARKKIPDNKILQVEDMLSEITEHPVKLLKEKKIKH